MIYTTSEKTVEEVVTTSKVLRTRAWHIPSAGHNKFCDDADARLFQGRRKVRILEALSLQMGHRPTIARAVSDEP